MTLPLSLLLFHLPCTGFGKACSLLPNLISSDLTSFLSSTCLPLPSFGTRYPVYPFDSVCKILLGPHAFPATPRLGLAHPGVPDIRSSMTSQLNKHHNNVKNCQKAARCRFCQVGSRKQEIPSMITIILLKKSILTLKIWGKVIISEKQKCFSKNSN